MSVRATPAPPALDARSWLDLIEAAESEAKEAHWRRAVPVATRGGSDAPLIDGTMIRLAEAPVRRWLSRVWRAADHALGATASDRVVLELEDCAALLRAGIEEDWLSLDATADRVGVSRGALRSVAVICAMPLLRACRAAWADRVDARWTHGECPICGAWPVLAEVRGLERTHRLRCGNDGMDWAGDWLRCPYCGNDDHSRLGALVPEGDSESRRAETCDMCGGYVKCLATLATASPVEVSRLDISSIDLDIAALDRGFARPARRRRCAVHVGIEPRRPWMRWRG